MRHYVVGFMIDASNRVLLIRKRRPAWQAGRLNGVGGKAEDHESPHAAMVREFAEETGIVTKMNDWQRFVEMRTADEHGNYRVHFFVARGDLTAARKTTDENIEVHSATQLDDINLIWSLRWLIPLALDPSVRGVTIVEDAGVMPTPTLRRSAA